MTLYRKWNGSGAKAKLPPNPKYPEGIDVDLSKGAQRKCSTGLQYPAPEVGQWVVGCLKCGYRGIVTAAGRLDDPRRVTVPCREVGTRQ